MPTHAKVYSKDEELGKRDDDFRPKRAPTASTLLQPWKWRKRRVFAAVALLIFIYVFVHNIPTDLGPWDTRMPPEYRPPSPQDWWKPPGQQQTQKPVGPPDVPTGNGASTGGQEGHYYNGPIKFYDLKDSLLAIARTQGSRPLNRNVLFAASSLRSAANLLPMACEMFKQDRNFVHFALMGRDPLPLEDVLEVNGVDREKCAVFFHDARGDYSEFSSDLRAEVSVSGAMKHMNDYMHPQVIITDDSAVEDQFFTRAMRAKGKAFGRPVIEIPAGKYEDFLWMSMLDSGGLSNWFKPSIDILVQAPQGSSGSLIRLLKSLEYADYAGLKAPRLIVELPSKVEPFAVRYLEELQWPPTGELSPLQQSSLILRHRIPSARMSSEQASLRFIEGYYPTSTQENHVLVLSPQAELSPLYLQYLYYLILEYRYSLSDLLVADAMVGISLEVPTTFINGSGKFVPPTISQMKTRKGNKDDKPDQDATTAFLYGAPSSSASLFFGDKWATFHDFMTNRLVTSHSSGTEKPPKLVSENEPAWLEFLLELMRARGWSMMHPASSFATIHNDLAQVPEEFLKTSKNGKEDKYEAAKKAEEEPFLAASTSPEIVPRVEHEPVTDRMPLLESLPFDGKLPELAFLPYLLHTGDKAANSSVVDEAVESYIPVFRRRTGGCDENTALPRREPVFLQSSDLFCLPGMELDFEPIDVQGDEEKVEKVAQAIVEATAMGMDDAAARAANLEVKEAGTTDAKPAVVTEAVGGAVNSDATAP